VLNKISWVAMTLAALLIAGFGLGVVLVPALRVPFIAERFAAQPLAAYAHMLGGAVALALGPFQLNARLRARRIALHRILGRLYVAAVLAGGVGGIAIAPHAQGGLVAHVGFGMLGVLWLITALAATWTIRRGQRAAHRRWMIRCYALTFAAVTLRIYVPLSLANGLEFAVAYQAIAWLAWVPNLIVAEWWFLRPPRDVAAG
jgi:uncharacterized membrane protein